MLRALRGRLSRDRIHPEVNSVNFDLIYQENRFRAIVGGSALLVAGLVGLSLWLATDRQPTRERVGIWRHLLIIGSALFVALGGLALLGFGVIAPLRQVLNQAETPPRVVLMESLIESERLLREILNDPRHQDSKKLNRYEYKVSSQNGEDGVIAEIFRRIGTTNRYFVEFGASDGDENNTALLVRQGWGGFWIDGDGPAVARARQTYRPEIGAGRLVVREAFITAENIEGLFSEAGVPPEPDLLSIDIDRNDYHVWEKIRRYRPRVGIVEYNAGLPASMSWFVPYDPKAQGWNSFGNGNGASLKALELLGKQKGYSLVGCELTGVNAFFVRDDLLGDHFVAPYTSENHFEPFRYSYLRVHPQLHAVPHTAPAEEPKAGAAGAASRR